MTAEGKIAQAALDLGALRVVGMDNKEAEEAVTAVRDRYGLTEDELRIAVDQAIASMWEAAQVRQEELDRQRSAVIENARTAGRNQAEFQSLVTPMPWTRDEMATLADGVVDHWAGHFADKFENGDEHEKDLLCALIDGARRGFIERAVELSFTSVHEGGKA